MNIQLLVSMANDIGRFFGSEPTAEARVTGVFDHLRRFWDPRMRRQIAAYVRDGGSGLADQVHGAVLRLDPPPAT